MDAGVVSDFLAAMTAMLSQMSPYLLLGFLLAGLLHCFVPRQAYARHLSGNGFGAAVKAALIGIPLPLCSCGVIPTTVGLRKSGASEAASVSFLISTPQTGVDSIFATYSLLGLPFAIARPIVALITAIAGGKLVGTLGGGAKAARDPHQEADCHNHDHHDHDHDHDAEVHGFWPKLAAALRYGFVDMMRDIGKWLIIGLILAAVITVALPDDFFAGLADKPILNMLVVLCIAAPMYICATGSIPIALSLMLKGLSPGAALVLLMAGPATNVASILVIGRVMGRRTLLIYLLTITAGAVIGGLIIDYLLPAEWFQGHMALACCSCCQAGCVTGAAASLTGNVCSVALIAALAWAFISKKIETKRANDNHQADINMREYKIRGMMCGHCKANVEKHLATVAGVTAVTVDLQNGVARVEGDHDPKAVIDMIGSLGYEYVDHH